jgi:hypothetical protein
MPDPSIAFEAIGLRKILVRGAGKGPHTPTSYLQAPKSGFLPDTLSQS